MSDTCPHIIGEVNSGHDFFKEDPYIYPVFDVESIGDVPRVPRTHLDVVFAQTIHVYYSTPVSI